MKYYSLRYYLMIYEGFRYKEMPKFPSFDYEKDAIEYWDKYQKVNFVYDDNVVVVRREISSLLVKKIN